MSAPNLEPLRQALERGTSRARIRRFVAVCPHRSHALVEVFPTPDGLALFSDRLLEKAAAEPAWRSRQVSGHTVELLGNHWGPTETVWHAALVGEAPKVWWTRCCCLAAVETEWVRQQIDSGQRRAVVPDDQLPKELGATL